MPLASGAITVLRRRWELEPRRYPSRRCQSRRLHPPARRRPQLRCLHRRWQRLRHRPGSRYHPLGRRTPALVHRSRCRPRAQSRTRAWPRATAARSASAAGELRTGPAGARRTGTRARTHARDDCIRGTAPGDSSARLLWGDAGDRRSLRNLRVLDHDFEMRVIERRAGRHVRLYEAFALASGLHFQRAVVTVRVIAGPPEEHMTGPGAACQALFRVVASAAETPQIIDRAIAHVAQGSGAFPNLTQRVIANVAACPGFGGQRRTALDRAVGLDTE